MYLKLGDSPLGMRQFDFQPFDFGEHQGCLPNRRIAA
jgi:hypothetical protein